MIFAAASVITACKRGGGEASGADADGDAASSLAPTGSGGAASAGSTGDDAASGGAGDGAGYRSDDGHFVVRFPYPTEPKTEVRPITGGFEHVAKTTGELGTYLVGYDDTLKFADPRSAKRVLDDVMGNTLRANRGKLVEKATPLTLAGRWPGRSFTATMVAKDKRPIRGVFHLYVVKTRVYQVVALLPGDKTVPEAMPRDFFASFALL